MHSLHTRHGYAGSPTKLVQTHVSCLPSGGRTLGISWRWAHFPEHPSCMPSIITCHEVPSGTLQTWHATEKECLASTWQANFILVILHWLLGAFSACRSVFFSSWHMLSHGRTYARVLPGQDGWEHRLALSPSTLRTCWHRCPGEHATISASNSLYDTHTAVDPHCKAYSAISSVAFLL